MRITRHHYGDGKILCRPRGTRVLIARPPTVETVGYHLSRPRRSRRASFAHLSSAGRKAGPSTRTEVLSRDDSLRQGAQPLPLVWGSIDSSLATATSSLGMTTLMTSANDRWGIEGRRHETRLSHPTKGRLGGVSKRRLRTLGYPPCATTPHTQDLRKMVYRILHEQD